MTQKPKDYTLRLYATGAGNISIKDIATTPTTAPATGPMDLTHRANGWTWTKVRTGGFWDASFSITGTREELHGFLRQWLAYRIEERAGIVTWNGMLWTMELSGVNIPLRVSMDDVWNAVRSEFREHLNNVGFEESGSGNVFSGWTDNGGTIASEGTIVARDSAACRLANNGSVDGAIYQDVTVETGAEYRFSVYTRGDGASAAGHIIIRDTDNASDIIAEGTGVTRDNYRRVTYDFVAPQGCTTVRVGLSNQNTQSIYFDQASFVRLIEGRPANSFTSYYSNTQSINRYGRKELTVNARDKTLAEAQTLAQTELKRRAWPRITPSELQLGEPGEKPTLTVYCVGYVVTTMFLYAPAGKGYLVDSGTLANEAITNNTDFVHSRNVETLGVKTRFSQDDPPRVFDLLQIVASEGASSDGVVYIKTDSDRGIEIKPILKEPVYYLRGGKLYDSPGSQHPTNARLVEPAMVKDLDHPGQSGFIDDIYDDSSLFLMEALQVDDQNEIQPLRVPPALRVTAEAR